MTNEERAVDAEVESLKVEREQFQNLLAEKVNELKLMRQWLDAQKQAVVDTVGGADYENIPTHFGNYLQRLRILVEAEKERDQLAQENERLREALRGIQEMASSDIRSFDLDRLIEKGLSTCQIEADARAALTSGATGGATMNDTMILISRRTLEEALELISDYSLPDGTSDPDAEEIADKLRAALTEKARERCVIQRR